MQFPILDFGIDCFKFSALHIYNVHFLPSISSALPLPSVVLRVEEKVGTDNGDTHGHHDQDHVYEQHEPKDIVDLVLPEGCEDKIPEGGLECCKKVIRIWKKLMYYYCITMVPKVK